MKQGNKTQKTSEKSGVFCLSGKETEWNQSGAGILPQEKAFDIHIMKRFTIPIRSKGSKREGMYAELQEELTFRLLKHMNAVTGE